jgi:hypothetical protein
MSVAADRIIHFSKAGKYLIKRDVRIDARPRRETVSLSDAGPVSHQNLSDIVEAALQIAEERSTIPAQLNEASSAVTIPRSGNSLDVSVE